MSSLKLWKNKIVKISRFFLVFAVITAWLFTGWPVIWKNPRIPPRIKEAQAAVGFHTFAISTPTTATTTFTIPIPATIVANEDLYVLFVSRDHTSGTALATLTDNDSGGNTWTRIGGSTDQKLNLFWKKATSATASKTITVAGAVGSSAGGLSAFTGGASGNPTTNFIVEDNASANETHAGFTPDVANSFIVFGVINATNDIDITLLAAATLGALEPEQWAAESTGGSDCKSTLTGKVNSGTTATGNFTWAQTNAITRSVSFAIKPPAVTTISNFVTAEPSNSTIAPGASGQVDSFGLQTNGGADTVTGATVTLAAGTGARINSVAITNDGDTTTYCSAAPSGDTATLSSCGIPVSTTNTQFKVKITAISHASMPAPPGGTYSVTGTVTAFTSTNTQSGSDTGSATVTVDNASPANGTWGTITPGNQQVSLIWSNPGDVDFNKVLILRKAGSAVTDAPTEGTEYSVPGTIGDSTIIYVNNGTTFTDTGLINSTSYYYKIFTYDSHLNYASGAGSGPHTPFATVVSVSISDGVVTYSMMSANTSKTTLSGELNDMQTATNDGNVTENFNIKGQNASGGGCTWILASTNGNNQYVHRFCNDTDNDCTSPPTSYTVLTTSYQPLDTGIGVSGTVQIQLRLTTPNPSTCFGQQDVNITIQAVQQ